MLLLRRNNVKIPIEKPPKIGNKNKQSSSVNKSAETGEFGIKKKTTL